MEKDRLKIGLLLDGYDVSAWAFHMFENILDSDYCEIILVVLNNNPKPVTPPNILSRLKAFYHKISSVLVSKILGFVYSRLIERQSYLTDANEQVDAKGLLADISTMEVRTDHKVWSDYFLEKDLKKISKFGIDIFIRCGFGILRGDILNAARYGVWSYHHGDNKVNRGGPPGFWESMESWTYTGSILQILTEDLDNGKVLYRSYSCTDTMSIAGNRSNYYWKSLSFMTRKIQELYRVGEKSFFEKVLADNKHPTFYSEKLYVKPTNFDMAKLLLKKMKERIFTVYDKIFYVEQWILMFHIKDEFSSSLWRYKKLMPPSDRDWADPHIIKKDDKYYIFIEELLYKSGKGHISLITMDKYGVHDTPKKILDKPYHLSYPLVLQYDDEYYMIPETHSNLTVELYKCTDFPYKWEFQMNLIENINAVDATVLFHNNKWWMFANVVENEGASSWDELFLYYSDKLLTTDWTPHPFNPIVSDCRTSRPAGKIFSKDGSLYRPSQNCSVRYGYGFNIFEIVVLNENTYEEVLISSIEPNWDEKIIGTHTFNRVGSLHVIDAIYKRRK